MKLRTNFGLLTAAVLLVNCTSSTSLLQKRQYDQAIVKSVKALDKKATNQKEINVLAKAYRAANEQDNSRVKMLVQGGEPQVYEEVHQIYTRLKWRKDLVKPLGPGILRQIGFDDVDYDQNIIDSRRKAAAYLFNEGTRWLAKKNRPAAREAYGYYQRAKQYMPSYPGIDDSLQRAYSLGITHVCFKVQNSASRPLPPAYQEDLAKISVADLQDKWVSFDTRLDPGIRYDYMIVLTIRKISISPNLTAQKDEVETRQVEDGREPLLDTAGNALRDSAGNELTKVRFKTLTCSFIRFSLGKTATVDGTLDIVNQATGQMVKTDPVSAASKWEFVYIMTKGGDVNALSPETRKHIGLKLTPYPSNDDMILQTGENLKNAAKDLIYTNTGLLE